MRQLWHEMVQTGGGRGTGCGLRGTGVGDTYTCIAHCMGACSAEREWSRLSLSSSPLYTVLPIVLFPRRRGTRTACVASSPPHSNWCRWAAVGGRKAVIGGRAAELGRARPEGQRRTRPRLHRDHGYFFFFFFVTLKPRVE
jgi:hypothetical protein